MEDVRVFPGTDPGAEDIFLEFDMEWRGKQKISLLLNPAPKFLLSVPGLGYLVDKVFTWTVSCTEDTHSSRCPGNCSIVVAFQRGALLCMFSIG